MSRHDSTSVTTPQPWRSCQHNTLCLIVMETVGCDVKSRLAAEAERRRQKGALQTRTRCRWTYFWFALWTRNDTGLLKTSSPPETGAGRYAPKLYGVFQNYTGFAGFGCCFFHRWSDELLGEFGSCYQREQKYFVVTHIYSFSTNWNLVPDRCWCQFKVIPTCKPAKNWCVFFQPELVQEPSDDITVYICVPCIFMYLRFSHSGGQHVSTTVAARFVSLHGHSRLLIGKINANYLSLYFHKLNIFF